MSDYNTIQVLEGLEHIRKRPGMYIGTTEDPTHLALEVLDNAIDEAAEGATSIEVRTDSTRFSIADNGRGFPIADTKGNDAVVSVFTKLFSGGKFDSSQYKSSRGLNGVGLTAVNALSSEVRVITRRKVDKDSRFYRFVSQVLDETSNQWSHSHILTKPAPPGTYIYVEPDPSIFTSVKVDDKKLKEHCRLAVTLNPSLKIVYNDKVIDPYTEADLVGENLMTPLWTVDVSDNQHQRLKLYFGYAKDSLDWRLRGAVNRARCDSGSHINATLQAIYDAWEPWLKGRTVERGDVGVGLSIFSAADIQNPGYTSQTKERLEVRISQLSDLRIKITDAISKVLDRDPEVTRKVLKKFEEYRKQVNRINSGAYLDQVVEYGTSESGEVRRSSGSLQNKLIECTSNDRENTELIIVEGDSAAGPAIRTRDRNKHAILPLRGKILNVVDQSIQRIMDSTEIRSLINGIGAGAFHKQSVDRIRYGRIVICTDADADGQHILALLIGALCYCVPQVVLAGRVYVCLAPLYGQSSKGIFTPIYSEDEIDKSKPFDRFKGLGSCDDAELHRVLFDEKHRRLVQLQFAEEDIHDILHIVSTSVGKREVLERAGLL